MGKNKLVDFKTHEFKLRHKDELNTFKFVATHRVAMDYFLSQKEILTKNMEDALEKYKTTILQQEVHKLQLKQFPGFDPKRQVLPPADRKTIRKAMKLAEAKKKEHMNNLNKTFNNFLAANERMYNHMNEIMETDSMDLISEDLFTFIDTIIVEKK